jgi:hypothetical protein
MAVVRPLPQSRLQSITQQPPDAMDVDTGPPNCSAMIDGALNDSGPVRQFGWGRFGLELGDVNGNSRAVLAKPLLGQLKEFRLYDRCLRTSEAVGNFRAERLTTHL